MKDDKLLSSMLTASVVINTTDRANSLALLLQSLELQSYSSFEVIVVVGPTKDNTLEILEPYHGRVRVLHCSEPNLSKSRNIGLAVARGDIVAFIDDDAVPCYHWLKQIVQRFQNTYLSGTGGIVCLVHPNLPTIQHRIGVISSLAEQVDVRQSWFDALVPETSHLGHTWVPRMMGANMAFRRLDLLEIGGFDEFYEWVYDDTDIALRLVHAGKVVEPFVEAPVYHVPGSSRNRNAFTYVGRWWIRTKAATYFAIKNGSEYKESKRAQLKRCLHIVHGHWLWLSTIRKYNHISRRQFAYFVLQDGKNAMHGIWAGLQNGRTTLSNKNEPVDEAQAEAIQPFQNAMSISQPSVDPVAGRATTISMPDTPLRICLLSGSYPPEQYEGVGRMTNVMARGLFAIGHTVHVIARGPRPQTSFYDGAYVHRITSPLTRYERYRMLPTLHHTLNYSHAVYEKVRRLILNDGIQVVDSPLWQVDGLVTAKSGDLPVMVRSQTALRQVAQIQEMRNEDLLLVGELEQAFLRQASFVSSNSMATARALQHVYDIKLDEIKHGIVHIGAEAVADEAVRPFNLDQPPSKYTVLYVGRLEKRKGISDLFGAIPKVLAEKPNVQFVIAGDDNSISDGFQAQKGMSYVSYFQQNFPQYAQQVTFLGHVEEDELQRLYQSCDLFVAPSLYESFGQIYLEAMNYAKPVIGCRAGGIPEVVEDGVTGLLVDPESPAKLAEAMLRLLRSPQKLYEMGIAGRQRLLEKFTHIEMARNFAKIYRTLIYEKSL